MELLEYIRSFWRLHYNDCWLLPRYGSLAALCGNKISLLSADAATRSSGYGASTACFVVSNQKSHIVRTAYYPSFRPALICIGHIGARRHNLGQCMNGHSHAESIIFAICIDVDS